DPSGLEHWRLAAQELLDHREGKDLLQGVSFEYLDFEAHPAFRSFLRRYPKGCTWGAAGKAIVARVVCHLVLPPSVDRVISIDLGDILVLDDIKKLWDLGHRMEDHHLLAASHAVSLHHINGQLPN
ncbi:unnamed protein product, partial [Polarella glacialis]